MNEELEREVSGTETIGGDHLGTLRVLSGGQLTIAGRAVGTVVVGSEGYVDVTGDLVGTMNLESEARMVVHGTATGTLNVERGGTFEIAPGGKHVGTTNNYGAYLNRGSRGGWFVGNEPDDDGGRVLEMRTEGDVTIVVDD